jgi:hypothetical protein
MTMPQAYTTPLTNRHEIAEYLLNRRGRYYRDHGHLLFCFNVKVYDPDLSFETLLTLYQNSGCGTGKADDPGWVEEARLRYAETDLDDLYQMAVDDASRQVTDSDSFTHLYDGTPVEAEYEFVGRSCGWVALTKFEGVKLTDPERLKEVFEGDSFEDAISNETLHRLYALVRMLEHDLTPQRAQDEIEHQAAFGFFEVVCGDIPPSSANLGAYI